MGEEPISDPQAPGPSNRPERSAPLSSFLLWLAFLLFLILFASTYAHLSVRYILGSDTNLEEWNQEAYLEAVFETKVHNRELNSASPTSPGVTSAWTRNFPHFFQKRIDPLWPWMVSFIKSSEPEHLLREGRVLNASICGVALIILGLVMAKSFSILSACAFLLVAGLGYYLDRAVWFRPDGVVSLLTLLAWVCILSLLRHNALWKYGILGFLMALLYLAQSSICPILFAFFIVSLLQSVANQSQTKKGGQSNSLWNSSGQIVGLAVGVTLFMIVAGPRLNFANDFFGNAFHRFDHLTMWLGNPAEAEGFVTQFASKTELETLTSKTKPSGLAYLDENGPERLLERSKKGVIAQWQQLFPSDFRNASIKRVFKWAPGWWLVYFGLVFVIVSIVHRVGALRRKSQVWRVGQTSSRWVLLFSTLAIGFTVLWMGIGNPPHRDDLVVPSLFVPLLLTFIWISERFIRQLRRTSLAKVASHVMLLAMVLPTAFLITRIVVLLLGGEDRLI